MAGFRGIGHSCFSNWTSLKHYVVQGLKTEEDVPRCVNVSICLIVTMRADEGFIFSKVVVKFST